MSWMKHRVTSLIVLLIINVNIDGNSDQYSIYCIEYLLLMYL